MIDTNQNETRMTGPTLLEAIDTIEVADRIELERTKPFRFCVADVYKRFEIDTELNW